VGEDLVPLDRAVMADADQEMEIGERAGAGETKPAASAPAFATVGPAPEDFGQASRAGEASAGGGGCTVLYPEQGAKGVDKVT
jgi:hypothetical protein